ncbi:HD domain-containing protein [Daejeonella sp.]|uniref:HD domain-containing protein n=1 Tax=Daejeonella sp. TaxID=2805397 RepID=UPI002717D289|nr:HD domain-containing protein [Daejeonella sp.]MDO8993618.1 HD domain-containing protein [Daejeonella sp.]MDP2413339.1 HD domain-containing protein [Daejeonella sp.]
MKAAKETLKLNHDQLIAETVKFVKHTLEGAESGHDWWHIQRVWNNALQIIKTESAEQLTVELAALLHDIADSKFHDGDEEIGPKKAEDFLSSQQLPENLILHVQQIIRNMSFKASLGKVEFHSKELEIVQDADRLDAIGAIGIARAFTYGGFKNRELYNPEVPPALNMSKEEYKNSAAPTINHFYEKLLLLKDKMNTESGRKIAAERHLFMEQYLEQFYREWKGK